MSLGKRSNREGSETLRSHFRGMISAGDASAVKQVWAVD